MNARHKNSISFKRVLRLTSCLLMLISLATPIAGQDEVTLKIQSIERFLDTMVKEWKIPGLAIGIVYKDKMVYSGSFGYRDLKNKLPVTSRTMFPIASNTKLFTSILACMLLEEGYLSIDEPVRNFSTKLKFSTDELNAKITLRDMLSHRTGLGRYDGIWKNAELSPTELIERLAYMQPTAALRQSYDYNNIMYGAAGYVIESLMGKSWEELTNERIFYPLQMDSTCFSVEKSRLNGNYSLSYYTPPGSNQFLLRKFTSQPTALYPSCLIKSNIEDMGNWMIALLNDGDYNDNKVFSCEVISQTMKPNSIVDEETVYRELSHPIYGLGRRILMYKGLQMTMHTGSINGFYSNLSLFPQEKLGVFIVHNYCNAGCFRLTLALPIIDRFLNLESTDWDARWKVEYQNFLNKETKRRDIIESQRVLNTRPSHPLSHYKGVYSNPIYGKMEIAMVGNQLQFIFRGHNCPLFHYHYDQFITSETMADEPDFHLFFLTNAAGKIDRISCEPYGDPAVDFYKIPDKK